MSAVPIELVDVAKVQAELLANRTVFSAKTRLAPYAAAILGRS